MGRRALVWLCDPQPTEWFRHVEVGWGQAKTVCRPLASGCGRTRWAFDPQGLRWAGEAWKQNPAGPFLTRPKYRPAAHCRTRTRARGRSIVNPAAFIAPSVRRPPTMRNMLRSRSSNFSAFLKTTTAIS